MGEPRVPPQESRRTGAVFRTTCGRQDPSRCSRVSAIASEGVARGWGCVCGLGVCSPTAAVGPVASRSGSQPLHVGGLLPVHRSSAVAFWPQPCVFRVDYTVEAIGNREFGSVFLNASDNVAIAVVANGWAKVGDYCTFHTASMAERPPRSWVLRCWKPQPAWCCCGAGPGRGQGAEPIPRGPEARGGGGAGCGPGPVEQGPRQDGARRARCGRPGTGLPPRRPPCSQRSRVPSRRPAPLSAMPCLHPFMAAA